MPIPIMPIGSYDKNEKENNSFLDLSFLNVENNDKMKIEASNHDADNMMKIWMFGERLDGNKYKINPSVKISAQDLNKLKYNGFIVREDDVITFTQRGKHVITTMTLGENNNFLSNQKKRSYKEILASIDKRDKKGYRLAK